MIAVDESPAARPALRTRLSRALDSRAFLPTCFAVALLLRVA